MANKQILSIDTNAKTIKGQALGIMTGILYLAPHKLSGFNTCPFAEKAGCIEACLNTAGRGAFNSIQKARIAKTQRFFNERLSFMNDLVFSIEGLIKKANKANLKPVVRLNGTSDIRFENIPVIKNGVQYKNIMELFSNIQFYDYTKDPNRSEIPANYDLTFSYSGVESFERYNKLAAVNKALNRIAVVFDKADTMPKTFLNRPVVDGDASDVRFFDDNNVIVGLYAKGKARKDTSGFVVKTV